jgi:orotate phosphoribosyltransferase
VPRRLWLDPRILPRLRGRRVLLVDDVISTGTSAQAGVALLARAGLPPPVALCVAMAQGDRWCAGWATTGVPVAAAYATPLFRRGEGGWIPMPGTRPAAIALPRPGA